MNASVDAGGRTVPTTSHSFLASCAPEVWLDSAVVAERVWTAGRQKA